jgi:hypothetical protein
MREDREYPQSSVVNLYEDFWNKDRFDYQLQRTCFERWHCQVGKQPQRVNALLRDQQKEKTFCSRRGEIYDPNPITAELDHKMTLGDLRVSAVRE